MKKIARSLLLMMTLFTICDFVAPLVASAQPRRYHRRYHRRYYRHHRPYRHR